MSKEDRLVKRVENLDHKLLKEQVKIVNEFKVVDKIRIVGIKKLEMANAFTLAVEAIAEQKGEEEIPDSCSNLYNDLHTDEESPLDTPPANKVKATKPKPKAEKKEGEKKKKTGPPQKPVDEYGTREGTLAHTFVQKVKESPQTMEEVRKADWNPRGYHFNDTLERLVEEEKATVDEDSKVITIS